MELRIPNPFTIPGNLKLLQWKYPVNFILICILIFYHAESAQNSKTCLQNVARTAANCSNRHLDFVPWRLHNNIIVLDLSSNNFSVLDNKSFVNYIYIAELYLRNNSMHTIRANAFLKLNTLRMLDLSNNKLAHIPSTAFNVVSHSLHQLILAGNKISHIPKGAFSQLRNLQHLDLSGNSIYNLDHGAFGGLTSITVFKIRHNAIKYLPSDSFDDFPRESMTQVQLYDNRWICDCQLRWLWEWMNETRPSVWESPGYPIHCDGPSIVRHESLNALDLDKLTCRAKMKTSGSTRELVGGANTTLLCKYTIIPKVEAVWLKNSDPVDVKGHGKKYELSFNEAVDTRGVLTYVSKLRVNDFKYEDIARYRCFIKNIMGSAYTEYKLTLKGVNFDSVVVHSPHGHKADDEKAGVDTMSIIIAVAVVFGIILLIFIAVLIFCSVNRMQRKKQAKRDKIVEHVKEHFIKNSEVNGNGDTSATDTPSGKTKPIPMSRGLDDGGGPGMGGGCQDDNRSCSNHTNDSTYKPPLDLDESEPMLIMSGQSPGSPLNSNNNGNTYVSFGSEFTDPGEFPAHVPVYSNSLHQTPILGNNFNRYDTVDGNGGGVGPAGSHEGSATPLLDRFTPVFLDDSYEPVEDYAIYPIYDSATNSLQHPRLTPPPATVINPTTNNSHYNNNIYSNIEGGKIYGTLPAHLNNLQQQQHPLHPRGGSTNSYNSNAHNRSLGSQSSFHYPPNQPSSMPRTPGSVRSVAAVPPWNGNGHPHYTPGLGNGSPPIIENHYHPPPLVHRPNPEYRDYREMRYPPNPSTPPVVVATPPSNRDVVHAKNHLGYSPVPSSSGGPRKPPRIYIPGSNNDRDCIELTSPPVSATLSSTVGQPQPLPSHDSNSSSSSDYITSSEAQQYSKNYGITPGTPV